VNAAKFFPKVVNEILAHAFVRVVGADRDLACLTNFRSSARNSVVGNQSREIAGAVDLLDTYIGILMELPRSENVFGKFDSPGLPVVAKASVFIIRTPYPNTSYFL
jgi:hypothetical protein